MRDVGVVVQAEPTELMWVIFEPAGKPLWDYMSTARIVAQHRFTGGRVNDWKQFYGEGYRCRRMLVRMFEHDQKRIRV